MSNRALSLAIIINQFFVLICLVLNICICLISYNQGNVAKKFSDDLITMINDDEVDELDYRLNIEFLRYLDHSKRIKQLLSALFRMTNDNVCLFFVFNLLFIIFYASLLSGNFRDLDLIRGGRSTRTALKYLNHDHYTCRLLLQAHTITSLYFFSRFFHTSQLNQF